MSDNTKKIRRAKQIQAPLSYTSGAMGVAGLGALALRKKSPVANKIYAPLTTSSVGVGSVGSFNFARLQGLEAKHTPRKPRQNVYVVRNKKQIEEIKQGKRTVAKADRNKKKRDYSGAMVGSGSVVGATGLVGGGIPGARPNSGRLIQARGGKGTKTELTRHIVSGARGGVFGYREDAHRRFLNNQNTRLRPWKPNGDIGNAFERGRELGRTIPERKIIRHMKNARTASNVALAGGAGLVGGGLYLRHKQKQQKVSKAKRNDDYKFKSDAMIAGGGTTAAGSYLGARALDAQGKKWAKQAEKTVSEAHRINPKTGGVTVDNPGRRTAFQRARRAQSRVPDVRAHRSTDDIKWNGKDVFRGRTFKEAKKTGQLRGIASQSRYFANTYGNNAKHIRRLGIGGGLALAGAGLAHRKYELKPRNVSKALDSGGMMDFGLSSVHQGENVEISKKDWKNISEHQRRAKDSRQVKNKAKSVAGWGGAAIAGTAALAASRGVPVGPQFVNAARGMKHAGKTVATGTRMTLSRSRKAVPVPGTTNAQIGRGLQNDGVNYAKNIARLNPYGTAMLGGVGLLGGGSAVATGARANEYRHDRAISDLRKKRVSKAQKTVRMGNKAERKEIAAGTYGGMAAAPVGGWLGAKAGHGVKAGYQLGRTVGSGRVASAMTGARAVPSALRGAGGSAGMVVSGMRHPYKMGALMLGGAYVGGSAKLRQVNNRRRKAGQPIIKAYNPEDRRHRRAERATSAQPYVTGAAATGAGYYGVKSYKAGRSAVRDFRSGVANEGTRSRLVSEAQNFKPTGNPMGKNGKPLVGAAIPAKAKGDALRAWKKAARHPGGSAKIVSGIDNAKSFGKHTGKAAGLTAVAIGAKLGSDRLKGYYQGKGRTYRPLHRNTY